MASSPLTPDGAARKEIVSLCFSVVKYEAGAGTNEAHSLQGADRVYARKGLCTTWLDELVRPVLAGKTITDKVPCFLKPSEAFALPEDPDAPILMVGPGTGVAPFRGFVQRLFIERTPAAAAFEGRAWLLFGGPTSDSVLYKELWEQAAANKPGQFELTLAISREQTTSTGGKMYVQERLTERADELFERLAGGAHLYLCGLKGMQPGIEAALEAAAVARGLDFKTWIKALRKEKRYHVEVY